MKRNIIDLESEKDIEVFTKLYKRGNYLMRKEVKRIAKGYFTFSEYKQLLKEIK